MVIVSRRVRWNGNQAGVETAEERQHVLHSLRTDDQHTVAFAAVSGKSRGQAPRGSVESAEIDLATRRIRFDVTVRELVGIDVGAMCANVYEMIESIHTGFQLSGFVLFLLPDPSTACVRHSSFSNA